MRALPAGLVLLLMTRVLPRGIWWVRATVLGVLNIGACVLAAAGVSLLVLKPQAELDGVGALAGLLGAVCMASGIVLPKRWGRPEGVSLLAFTGWQLTVGCRPSPPRSCPSARPCAPRSSATSSWGRPRGRSSSWARLGSSARWYWLSAAREPRPARPRPSRHPPKAAATATTRNMSTSTAAMMRFLVFGSTLRA